MREHLFRGRRLNAAFRNTSMDVVVGLIEQSSDWDDLVLEAYCRNPRRRSTPIYKEEVA
jgi:hypothetical protein